MTMNGTRLLAATSLVGVVAAWSAYKIKSSRRYQSSSTSQHRASTAERQTSDARVLGGGERWDVGTGVAGYVWHAPQPRAVLLVQHGYGDHITNYLARNNGLIPKLLELGVSVYGFDLWGNGESPGPRGATDVEDAIHDHLAARRVLAQQPLPVFLFGHSLGGLVTATSVIRDQENVSGVILLAPAIRYHVNAFIRAVARAGAFLAPTLPGPLPAGPPDLLTNDAELADAISNDPLMYLGRVTWITLGTAASIAHANWAFYPELQVPLLAVHGTSDQNTDPGGSSQLVTVAASEDKSLMQVEGGLHALLDDTRRDETASSILDWMSARMPDSIGRR